MLLVLSSRFLRLKMTTKKGAQSGPYGLALACKSDDASSRAEVDDFFCQPEATVVSASNIKQSTFTTESDESKSAQFGPNGLAPAFGSKSASSPDQSTSTTGND